MITNRKCISAQKQVQEQGSLSYHTWGSWGRKAQLLEGVLWETQEAPSATRALELPRQAAGSCAKPTQPHRDRPLLPLHRRVAGHIPGSRAQAAWHAQQLNLCS